MINITIFTDGASRGNPGKASYGFVIYHNQEVLVRSGGYLGIATNNVAEYSAVLGAYKFLLEEFKNPEDLNIQLIADSRLVIEQLAGRFKIKNPGLIVIFNKIKELEERFGRIDYKSVPREQNKEADKEANKVLDNL